MKIRIDPHLSKLEVIQQLKALIVEYGRARSNGEIQESTYSFSDYLYQKSLDPVKRFLMLCIPEDSLESGVNYDQMINYWASKFQSFRGTVKIFEFLEELSDIMGIKLGNGNFGESNYVAPYIYNITTLEINFTEVNTSDINLFTSSSIEFFKSLLYYQELKDTYETIELELFSELNINLSGGVEFFSTYTATEEK